MEVSTLTPTRKYRQHRYLVSVSCPSLLKVAPHNIHYTTMQKIWYITVVKTSAQKYLPPANTSYSLFFLLACSTPVGIQSDFPVDRILTSTSASSLDNLRLFSSSAPWLANHDNKHDSRYVEVKLFELFRVTAIATQGGVDDTGSGRCFVRSYYLMYVNNRMKWVSYGGRKPKVCNRLQLSVT